MLNVPNWANETDRSVFIQSLYCALMYYVSELFMDTNNHSMTLAVLATPMHSQFSTENAS